MQLFTAALALKNGEKNRLPSSRPCWRLTPYAFGDVSFLGEKKIKINEKEFSDALLQTVRRRISSKLLECEEQTSTPGRQPRGRGS